MLLMMHPLAIRLFLTSEPSIIFCRRQIVDLGMDHLDTSLKK